jgi:ubiquinone/menaquinone biosynthesis C-methylase UbiE
MNAQPSPLLFFDFVNSYQRSAAIKSAIELDLFTAIGEACATVTEVADRCHSSERGIEILADNLAMAGFLTKENGRYLLSPDAALFLDRRSHAYLGGATEFLLAPKLLDAFNVLTDSIRKGRTAVPEDGTMSQDNPVWVRFARAMAPMVAPAAHALSEIISVDATKPTRILDLAAGHGLFGIALAQRNPKAEVVPVDWPSVLEVAKGNADAAGVGDRYHLMPGSAFEVEFGKGFDVVLLTNFLHHFDPATCEALLRKIYASLNDGGRVVTVEFVLDEDRLSPPNVVAFRLMMLAQTPGGDAYTFKELEKMASNAGFSRSEVREILPAMQKAVISYK